jgi:hypothetical protein
LSFQKGKFDMTPLIRSNLWQSASPAPEGLEHSALIETADGFRMEGVVVAVHEGAPMRATYHIDCDAYWSTREAQISVMLGDATTALTLVVAAGQRWLVADKTIDAVEGCADVDLGVSPVTNTLPIRRLNLSVGEDAVVAAAWVRFPALTVSPLRQRYTRLAENRYRYDSLESGFTAELVVDEHGLVVEYGNIWRRIAVDGA